MDDLHPQKRKDHNQKDDLSKRGPYGEFDKDSAQAWKVLINLYAEKVIAHTDVNDGSCRRDLNLNSGGPTSVACCCYRDPSPPPSPR